MTAGIWKSCLILGLGLGMGGVAFASTESKLPEVAVAGEIHSGNVDPDASVGSYEQPRWTASRSFTNSRVYVLPEDDVELEFWIVEKTDRATKAKYYLLQKEIEVGLGHGLQIDFYENDQKDFGAASMQLEGHQFELRWALAKWGALLLNPTLYFEYHQREVGPDRFEFRLLLGQDLAPKWRFSSNLQYETELWDTKVNEIALTAGVAHNITNSTMIGIESKAEGADDATRRGSYVWEYYAGPAIRWNPSARVNILLTHLLGFNADAHANETFLVTAVSL